MAQLFSCPLDFQELDSINTTTHFKIYTIFINLRQYYFSPYPEKICNFQKISRPRQVWLYNANSYIFFLLSLQFDEIAYVQYISTEVQTGGF